MDVNAVWNAFLTLAVVIGGGMWTVLYQKSEKLQDRHEQLKDEVSKVKTEYVHKEEISRVEHRIDRKFDELKEFFMELSRKQ